MSRYRPTVEAARDLDEIADFIARDNPTAAVRVIDASEERCRAPAERPDMGRSREAFAPNLRSSLAGRYVIFDRPDAAGIEVIRIVHGARDMPSLFP